MTVLHPYLTFGGNCREAMSFYQKVLGGELRLQSVGESPMADRIPEEMKSCILHAMLTSDRLVLMASDMVGEKGLLKGNSVSLMLSCTSREEAESCYSKLSEGGEQTYPLETTFWGALFGGLTDRFGHHWLLHCGMGQG
jgi:PhnB protein